jgi:hypothetical protein
VGRDRDGAVITGVRAVRVFVSCTILLHLLLLPPPPLQQLLLLLLLATARSRVPLSLPTSLSSSFVPPSAVLTSLLSSFPTSLALSLTCACTHRPRRRTRATSSSATAVRTSPQPSPPPADYTVLPQLRQQPRCVPWSCGRRPPRFAAMGRKEDSRAWISQEGRPKQAFHLPRLKPADARDLKNAVTRVESDFFKSHAGLTAGLPGEHAGNGERRAAAVRAADTRQISAKCNLVARVVCVWGGRRMLLHPQFGVLHESTASFQVVNT